MIEYELNGSLEERIYEEFGDVRFFRGSFRPKGPKMYKSCFGGIETPYKPVTYSKPDTGFKPAKDFGIGGGGIAHKVYGTPLIDRYRPDNHKPFGQHINIETMLPFGKKKKKIIGNIHFKYPKY